jgi:integrase
VGNEAFTIFNGDSRAANRPGALHCHCEGSLALPPLCTFPIAQGRAPKDGWASVVLEGKLARNVARLVKVPEHVQRERETWSKAEVRAFITKASRDRLHAAWRLSLYGLRRGEVLGLRWSDIDLRARTLTVRQARVLVDYKVRIEEPKSRTGQRTLPLDKELVAALTALRKRQASESADAGAAYQAGLADLDWYQGGEYVVTDQAGMPVHRSGTPTSSGGCSSARACAGSPCTTRSPPR